MWTPGRERASIGGLRRSRAGAATFLAAASMPLLAQAPPHWAYVPPQRPSVPAVRDSSWVRNPIDAFVLARLEREGLAPAPEAERATLLRRVSLDLTGLPPELGELDLFLRDERPDAYERAVDRLLASPHYGERMARAWLDLARYADSQGYEKDQRRTMWLYRDWVIAAFNANLPFDRFTLLQIAGDLVPGATDDDRIATGFHRNTMLNEEGGTDPEEFRVDAVVDRVNTTATVWLGTTLACAQCHDHKYDPFTQRDYYRLFACFNSTADGGRASDPTLRVPSAAQALELERAESALAAAEANAGAPPEIERLRAERDRIAAAIPTALVMRELEAPRATFVHRKGDFLAPGDRIEPGIPALFGELDCAGEPPRLALARWLTSRANPLAARVSVNRTWELFFGRALVATADDFGTRGDAPSHPDLLDWLAVDFADGGWDAKALARRIVTSATYRQSSSCARALREGDPDNVLLARAARPRLEVEMLRDVALAASGLLVREVGGPSVFPPQPEGIWNSAYSGDRWPEDSGPPRWRRGLYTFWKRTAPYPTFQLFEAPSRETCCTRRARTNTPLQALALMNDPAFVECAAALARRMIAEGGPDDAARVELGFRLCTARRPAPDERDLLLALWAAERAELAAQPEEALARVAAGGQGVFDRIEPVELAAWTSVATVLLNLDETLTRN